MSSRPGLFERSKRDDSATVAARIAELLRDDIIRGNLPAGTRINEVALAKRYGVSRIPLREALRIMEGQGLVEIRPFTGASVSELSVADVVDLWDIQEALETLALRLALPNLTNDDFRMAEHIARNAEREPDPRLRLALIGEFYTLLYGSIGRPRLLNLLRTLMDGEARYLYAYMDAVRSQNAKLPGPRGILAVLKKRDVDAAVAFLRDLRQAQREFLVQYLNDRQQSATKGDRPKANPRRSRSAR